MIRLVLGSAFPVVGLALAAAFTGPDLVTGMSGTPMVVSGGDPVSLASANFDGEACASTLLFGEKPDADAPPSVRVIAMALRPDGQAMELGIRNTSDGTPSETVVLLFDDTGRLVAISRPAALQPAATAHTDCLGAPTPSERAPI